MSLSDVVARAAEVGLPLGELTVGNEPGRVPSGPSGRWVLIPVEDGSTLLGQMDRGSFAGYGQNHDDDALLNALHHVLAGPVTPSPVDPVVRAKWFQRARSLAAALRARDATSPTVADIPEGTALDRIGPHSGFCLFLLDTPFHERSAPPTDLALERTGWLLSRPLPDSVTVAPGVPWFEQPAGGIMITLDRPVRWYADTGVLKPFVVG